MFLVYLEIKMTNLKLDEVQELHESINTLENEAQIQNDMKSMFESLQESLLLIKEDRIVYQNKNFKEMMFNNVEE